MNSYLLPGYSEAIDVVKRNKQPDPLELPLLPFVSSSALPEIEYVRDADRANKIIESLNGLSKRAISLDTEYKFKRPSIKLNRQRKSGWNDIRSIVPLVLSFTVWFDQSDGSSGLLRYVFDLREEGIKNSIQKLLRFRVPFIFHNIKAELFTLWALGIEAPIPIIFDTFISASCIHLGHHHPRALLEKKKDAVSEGEEIEAKGTASARRDHLLSLVGQCQHYGLEHPFSRQKDDLRNEFLNLAEGAVLTKQQIEYASSDAEWTMRLYAAQQSEIFRRGLSTHLFEIEFPYAVANAWVEWSGLYVSIEDLQKLKSGCENAFKHYAKKLNSHGITAPGSKIQFLSLMKSLGYDHLFQLRTKKGNVSLTDAVLELLENNHETIRAFRLYKKYKRLSGEEWLSGILIGADKRIHPNHRQLGAMTGRNTCSAPNIVGIGKIFRPIVKAPPGKSILELDYGQIEVGVAAAEYQDEKLIQAYNTGDVYAVMAKEFYADKLTPQDLELDLGSFKSHHPTLRDNMKTFVLAVIYNIMEQAIASKFGISIFEAKRQREKFLNLYPTLKCALEGSAIFGWYRGYASTITGLRREIHRHDRLTGWCNNYLRNTPIQGSAAVVFKRAMILLHREFRGTEVKIILTAYDAIVIECPPELIDVVEKKAASLMEHALRSFYPELIGKVEVNRTHPECWNKNGHFDSLDKFLLNPDLNYELLEELSDETLE